MNEDEKDPIAIVALDIPPAVVCSDGVCVIADEHPADAEDGSENSTPAQ
ncbi:hypothetical protein IW249_006420 [Micromonospora vinacea]|uniref:FxLD family lantipeptide n=1 Tax=Micromonospora vinacea TaxID=709878 RepID=A0ABS0KBZ0_9ACTN|nr:hypothetical protein [Micromonospora vinacea]MBG6106006.1 hypothetical protein [Micromonospora vinacea]WTA65718.1 hypothetical protein OHB51_24870 [Micromonospora sp. NBC_00855]